MVTIKDIAKVVGVSVSTVSRALNNNTVIKPKTREKIVAIANQMGYKPNIIAQKLVSKRFYDTTIGIVFSNVNHSFFFEILRGIHDGLAENDYNLMIFDLGRNRKQVFSRIITENLAGVLVLGYPLEEHEQELLKTNKIEFIYIDYHDQQQNSIYVDNVYGGKLVASYLCEEHCKQIAYVGLTLTTQQQDQRLEGLKKGLAESGLSLKLEKYIHKSDVDAYNITEEILDDQNLDIDGIFYFCDEIAIGGYQAILDQRKDVKVVGYDGLVPTKYLNLTTVYQPAFDIGFKAAESVIEYLTVPGRDVLQYVFKPQLLVRKPVLPK